MHPVQRAQRAQIHDALGRCAHDLGQLLHHADGQVWIVAQQIQERVGLNRRDEGVVQGHHRARPGHTVECSEFAEDTAAFHFIEANFAAGNREIHDPHPALDDEKHVSRFTLAVDDRVVDRIADLARALFERGAG